MKKKGYWLLIFTIFLACGRGLVIGEDIAENISNIEVKIELSDTEILLGEPLNVTMELINKGVLPIELAVSPTVYRIMLSEDGKEYKQYLPTGEMYKVIGKGQILKPGESYKKYQIVFYTFPPMFSSDEKDLKHFVFPKPGKYFVRGDYGLRFTSSIASVVVTQPKGEEAKVWAQLKKTDYPYFVQWGYADTSEEVINISKKIVQQYPKITYVPYIREALIKYYRHKKSRTSEETQYLETLIKEHYPNKKPEPKPSDILDQTIKKLESEWYDVTGFFLGKGNTRGEKEFEEKFLHLSDEEAYGNISTEEFYRQLAELLEKHVKTYSKPLPPDEWKHRYDIYAAEKKAQTEEIEQQIERSTRRNTQ